MKENPERLEEWKAMFQKKVEKGRRKRKIETQTDSSEIIGWPKKEKKQMKVFL